MGLPVNAHCPGRVGELSYGKRLARPGYPDGLTVKQERL